MNKKAEADFYLLPTRAWEFAIGALLPYAGRFMERKVFASLALLGGLLLLILALLFYEPQRPFPGWFGLLPTLGAALLILAGQRAGSPSLADASLAADRDPGSSTTSTSRAESSSLPCAH